MVDLKTDELLLAALRKAAKTASSPEEVWKQRISYIVANMGRESSLTRERIEEILVSQEGRGPR